MMIKKAAVLCSLVFFIASCEHKPRSVGRARDVLVFTEHPELIDQELQFALDNEVATPQPAKEFIIRYMKPGELEARINQHGMMFVGFERDSLMKELFPDLSANDSFGLYRINDLWAENQVVLVFLADDTLSMLVGLREVRSKIHQTFKYRMLDRLKAITYTRGRDQELSERVENYGFRLDVPEGWLLDERYAENNFIWVHAHEPDRSVFLYWEDEERGNLSAHTMVSLRDSLTALFYQGDYLDTTFTTAGPSWFRGKEAIKIEGVWQNDSMVVGGPMISYSFNEGGRFWIVDAMLFYPAPPAKKIFWLNQLEVIIATFEPLPEEYRD